MAAHIAYQDLKKTSDRLFFIVGTSRSGSTLLQSMLNSHSKVVIPPETHFFKSYGYLHTLYQEESKKEFRNKLIDFWYDQKTRIRDLGFAKTRVKEAADSLHLYTPLELFTLQMTMYRKQREMKMAGEKTPRHILHVPDILKAYPKAKVISLFRDPRAAAYSEIKAYFGSPSVIITTKRWQKYVAMHKQLERRLSDQKYMMLQYRDLIENPKRVLIKVSNFIGISYEKEMLNYYNRNEKGFADGEEDWKAGTFKPLKKNKNKEWKAGLSDEQVALIESQAGSYLGDMRYEATDISLSAIKSMSYYCWDMGRSAWATIMNLRDEGYISPKEFKF